MMAWVAIDSNNNELIFSDKPIRYKMGFTGGHWEGSSIIIPKGTIEKIIGRELTWSDEPIEIK